MVEIIKTYRQSIPATRFIGKRYGNEDRVDGMFGAKWGEWFRNGCFDALEALIPGGPKSLYEDGDAYLGMMRDGENGFEYWIGMFTPPDASVPEGYAHIDFPAGNLGVCWIYGKEDAVYMREEECADRLTAAGMAFTGPWCFERYGCPRFTEPDEKGNVILDICFYIE